MEATSGIHSEQLSNLLSTFGSERLLILDTRPFMCFNESHIRDSFNVHCPPILKRRSGGFVALENIVPCENKRRQLLNGVFMTVVAYDRDTTDLATAAKDSNLYSVLKSLKQQVDITYVYYLTGGFEAFYQAHPDLCVNPSFSPCPSVGQTLGPVCRQNSTGKGEPVEILPHLFLGDSQHAAQRELLQRLSITSLLNVSTTCQNHFETDFRYMNIPVNDNSNADLASWFAPAIAFIDSVKKEGGKVLVHCHAGVSRSATICLAYLMSTNRLALDTAYEHVRARRSVIDPNLNFMRQLKDFEKQLFRGSKLSIRSLGEDNFLPPKTPTTECGFSFSSHDFTFPTSAGSVPLLSPLVSPS